jgi:hypothetical protein
MLPVWFYISLLLIILLDNGLGNFKRVGHVGSMNRLSPVQQSLFWSVQLALAIAFAISSVTTLGYLRGLLIAVVGILFACIFYFRSLRFFIRLRNRLQHRPGGSEYDEEDELRD